MSDNSASDNVFNNNPTASTPEGIDPARVERAMENLRYEQNFVMGTLAAVVGALIGAAIWATITAATKYQIGYMAIAVGFLAGWGMRRFGKGLSPIFGVTGALIALLGCVLGNLFTAVFLISQQFDISMWEVVSRLDLSVIWGIMRATFSPIDLLFYGIAVITGYRTSFRQVSEFELIKALPER